ncbi:MAG: FAD-dependent oxidoreductase [bacterium]
MFMKDEKIFVNFKEIKMFDVIIIGAGPAGLTSALYATRSKLKTLVIESFQSSQIFFANKIENYPGFPNGINGFELLSKFKEQSKESIFVQEEVINIKKSSKGYEVITNNNIYNSFSVIIAVGAVPKTLGVDGEIKLKGKGISYCAICDAGFFKNKKIIAIGGGNTAIEEVLYLTNFVQQIIVINRKDKLRATQVLQERALSHPKINFLWNSQIMEILGENKVEAVKIKNIQTQEESQIICDGVFIFVGFIPNTNFLKTNFIRTGGLETKFLETSFQEKIVDLDEFGYIITDEYMNTSCPGIFACGDCRKTVLRQVITACADGSIAATFAEKYVEKIKLTKI